MTALATSAQAGYRFPTLKPEDKQPLSMRLIIDAAVRCPDHVAMKNFIAATKVWDYVPEETRKRIEAAVDEKIKEVGLKQFCIDTFRESRRWCFLKLKPGTEPLKALVESFLDTWQLGATDPERVKWARVFMVLQMIREAGRNFGDHHAFGVLLRLVERSRRRRAERDRDAATDDLVEIEEPRRGKWSFISTTRLHSVEIAEQRRVRDH